MILAERRAAELRYQKEDLLREFNDWRMQSNAGAPLAKNNSQIRRVTHELELFLEKVPASPGTFEDNERLADGLIYAHRIWAYFRSKFALRTVKLLQDVLKCVDEFAWECYAPAGDRAKLAGTIDEERLKEPPLVFFSSDASPFIRRRGTRYEVEGVTGSDTEQFRSALSILPIPVIGVPWVQVNHLPSAVVIAHEVGHAVENDFQITAPLNQSLDNLAAVDATRREAWRAWRSELFADVYGALCSGPAFALALCDYLAAPPDEVTNEKLASPGWGNYPTRGLRMEFNFAVLQHLGLEDAGLQQAWRDAYPYFTMPGYSDFAIDAPQVASAFLTTPLPMFGDVPIQEVLRTTPAEWQTVKDSIGALYATQPYKPGLFRRSIAAVTWAYHTDPDGYSSHPKTRSLAANLSKAVPGGTRGVEPGGVQQAGARRVAQDAADKESADKLWDLLAKNGRQAIEQPHDTPYGDLLKPEGWVNRAVGYSEGF